MGEKGSGCGTEARNSWWTRLLVDSEAGEGGAEGPMGRGQRRESCHRGARAARRGTLRAPPRALGLGTPPPPRTCWARQGEGTCSENWRGCPRARPSPSSVESVSRAPLRPILVSAGEPGAHSWGRPKGLGRAEAFLAAITCGCPRRLPLAGRSLSYMLCHPSIHIF